MVLNFSCISEDESTREKGKSADTVRFKFTDDTAMTRSVARSLADNRGVDVKDMAQKYFLLCFSVE